MSSPDASMNITVHRFLSKNTPPPTLLLDQGRNVVRQGVLNKSWYTPTFDQAIHESTRRTQFLYSPPPPRIPGNRSIELKEWDSSLDENEVYCLKDLVEFSTSDFSLRELIPVSTDREGNLSEGNKKLAHGPLNHLIPQPHILVPPNPRASSRQANITQYHRFKKSEPIPISPYALPFNDFDEYDRVGWIIPVRGKLPWPEATSAVLLDSIQALPSNPRKSQTKELEWTAAAITKFWEFLLQLRNARNLGPLGISFHAVPSPSVDGSVRVSRTAGTDTIHTARSSQLLSFSISSVDHIKIYHDWSQYSQLRNILDAWAFEPQSHKIRLLLGAKLVLMDARSRGILIL
ncbi:hypothetical protein NP233_g10044 [Leucocoprinus birnbaumii]|uniref:Uncharacterized protein n=1 Tax=Leucocoprinus birnbaumii TaxID=56174 RepID=A0AAD5YQ91_9AGAR|nr:hypothetical protein NP233_g10044 [Leucocoprinus birnbaumii]